MAYNSPTWAKVPVSDPYWSYLGTVPRFAHMGPIWPCLLGLGSTVFYIGQYP